MRTRNVPTATKYEHGYFSDGDEIIEIVPRQFPTPDEEMLTPLEGMYFNKKIINAYIRAYWTDNFLRGSRFRPNLSSRAVQYAYILLSLEDLENNTLRKGKDKYRELEFRVLYYHHTIEAVKNHAYIDILNACYAMCTYAMFVRLPWDEFIKHYSGFLVALETLATSPGTSQSDINFLSIMCSDILDWVYFYHIRRHLTEPETFPQLVALKSKMIVDIGIVGNSQRTTSWRLNPNVISRLLMLSFSYDINRRLESERSELGL